MLEAVPLQLAGHNPPLNEALAGPVINIAAPGSFPVPRFYVPCDPAGS